MPPYRPGRTLHAVVQARPLTARDALSWFADGGGEPDGRGEPDGGGERQAGPGVIGYTLAPAGPEWFRWDGRRPHGPAGARDLSAAFELVAADGQRQLRWVHRSHGTGRAVTLGEDAGLLPDGVAVRAGDPPPRRHGVARRLLAGRVAYSHGGWSILASPRYAPYDVPVTAAPGQQVWASFAEYATSDEHGNLTVTDTLLTGLQAGDPAIQPQAAPPGQRLPATACALARSRGRR